MSTEQNAGQSTVAKPSKVAITKLLAEAEVARRRAIKPWLLAFLLPLLIGAALIAFSSHAVYVRLQKIKQLDQVIADREKTIREKDKTIADKDAEKQNLTTGLNTALSKITSPEAKQEVINTIASNPTVAATTPRVFIQIHDEEQRKQADAIALALKSAGFIVPGIEKRADVKVDGNQVKYFRQEDKGIADNAAGVLTGQGVTGIRTVLAGGKVPPGQIEVCFAPAPPKPTPTPTADAVMTDVQNRVRRVIAMATLKKGMDVITSDSTLESLGATTPSHASYIRDSITHEFRLSSKLPDFTPQTTVGDIERLVYERVSKKSK
jgi:hypothetical protein